MKHVSLNYLQNYIIQKQPMTSYVFKSSIPSILLTHFGGHLGLSKATIILICLFL